MFVVKRAKKQAAVTAPAVRPPIFAMSAKGLSSSFWYSFQIGMRQARSRACSPHSRSSAASLSSGENSPVAGCPSANNAGAGQGGDINHGRRLVALGIRKCITEDESAFGIRI